MPNVSDYGADSSIHFMEIYGDSRNFQVTRKNITKKFTFVVQSERFLNESTPGTVPGTDAYFENDDVLVHKTLMEVFWSEVPMTYVFWLSDTEAVMLFASDMDVKQINWCTWRVEITYDIPDDNGSNTNTGAGTGSTGPSNGEVNSQRYTQVSFNASVGTTTIQKAKLLEVSKNTALPAGEAIPWTVGKYYPIGVSEDEISGAEVYNREFRFQITQYMPPTRITYAYVRRLSRLITCLNKYAFFGFAPGSVMFVGASGESDLYEAVPITLEFEVRNNIFFASIPNNIPMPPADNINYTGNVPVVDFSNQYDTIGDSDFPATSAAGVPGMATGIHSGWSIVSYQYLTKITANAHGGIVREPSHRLIYGHYDYQDFAEFLL